MRSPTTTNAVRSLCRLLAPMAALAAAACTADQPTPASEPGLTVQALEPCGTDRDCLFVASPPQCKDGFCVVPCTTDFDCSAEDFCRNGTCTTIRCQQGETRSCGTDVGECVAGIQRCENNQWGDCIGATFPESSELCDGLDSNCNGMDDVADQAFCGGNGVCVATGNGVACVSAEPSCGDGVRNGREVCDRSDQRDPDINDEWHCSDNCQKLTNFTLCTSDSECGDGVCTNLSSPGFCSPHAHGETCTASVPGMYTTGIIFGDYCALACSDGRDCPRHLPVCATNPFAGATEHEIGRFCAGRNTNN